MGLPSINITFKTTAAAAIARSQKGVVGLILRDANSASQGKSYTIRQTSDIPAGIDEGNAAYIRRALTGYINPPRKVVVYVLGNRDENGVGTEDLAAATGFFATQGDTDYLCGPHDCTSAEATEIAAWVKLRRANDHSIIKAVLPNQPADFEGVVNFATANIKQGDETLSTAAFCSRIAGLIAGTPMTISCTSAPLPELSDVARIEKDDADAAVDAGKLILVHDGEKVKVARGVNSLVTTTQDKDKPFQKLKIIEAIDMIGRDVRMTCQDNYVGKYANSYDNKCVLIAAIKGYLEGLELGGILDRGKSACEINILAQKNYLQSKGVNVDEMSEQEIKEANTDDQVFLRWKLKILDAIEDISIDATI